MPQFMDVHRSMKGITAEQLQAAHNADLAIQAAEHVNFKQAWADPVSGMVWCLAEAPDAEAVRRVHTQAGHAPDDVYPLTIQV